MISMLCRYIYSSGDRALPSGGRRGGSNPPRCVPGIAYGAGPPSLKPVLVRRCRPYSIYMEAPLIKIKEKNVGLYVKI